MVECQGLFLTATKIKKRVIKLLIILHMSYNLSSIAIRLKTMRNKAIDACSSAIQYVSDQYKTQ